MNRKGRGMENSRKAASLKSFSVVAVPAGGDPADWAGEPEGWLRGWSIFPFCSHVPGRNGEEHPSR